jgi:hypothetical protein
LLVEELKGMGSSEEQTVIFADRNVLSLNFQMSSVFLKNEPA